MSDADTSPSNARQVRVPVATMWASPDAPREVDAPALLDSPDVAGWAGAMDAETRRGLGGRTLTQALFGENVDVVEARGDWVRVVCVEQPASGAARGYPGWMRRAHLGAPAPVTSRAATVLRPSLRLVPADGAAVDLSFGTRLGVADVSADTATVLLPDGGRGDVPLGDVAVAGHEPPTCDAAADVLPLARMFLGLPYLWGGTSAWGLDCSGLVHLTHRALGVAVPRDASDQAASDSLEPVALTSVETGDLYFFARPGEPVHHVGFASRPFQGEGERWMLHAPQAGMLIEEAPMAPDRVETLVAARRVGTSAAARVR